MRFLVLDGIDGSGKNTSAHWACAWYREKGMRCEIWQHPSDRWTGKLARKALLSRGRSMRTLASIFYIVDVLTSTAKLRRHKGDDEVIIFVRYLMGTAYLPERFMKSAYDFFCKILPVPQVMLLVDIDPQVALSRIESRQDAKEMFEDLESLQKARRKTLALAGKGWAVLDNSGSADASRQDLQDILAEWEDAGLTIWRA
ncbi:MAG TPA: hypothetical protein VLH13_02385 [Methanomassiliicoccales archaeon]|nr:hypothetical protein [Methanomassiliicoccales archaeon]